MSVELVVTTSSPTDPSTAQYDETFGQVLKDYEKLMGQDHKPTNFESDKAVLEVLGKTVHRFEDYIDGNQRLKTWLESYVDLLFTVSATLWENTEVVSLTHERLAPPVLLYSNVSFRQHPSPEQTICNAIVVLIEVSLFQNLHAPVLVTTMMTIIPRPLLKLTRTTSRLWNSSIVFNFTFNASTISMVSPSYPTQPG